MAWHRKVDKPLPEPMLTQFTDIYVALGELGWWRQIPHIVDSLSNYYLIQ